MKLILGKKEKEWALRFFQVEVDEDFKAGEQLIAIDTNPEEPYRIITYSDSFDFCGASADICTWFGMEGIAKIVGTYEYKEYKFNDATDIRHFRKT